MGFHHTQGEVVALDRIRNKIDRIHQNAQMLNLCSVKAFCFNSTQAVSSDPAQSHEGTVTCPCPSLIIPMDPPGDDSSASVLTPGPPFPPESFDRVLLDAPCSGLGQRPNMANTWSLKEICSYQPLQRNLFHAVGLTAQSEQNLIDVSSPRPVGGGIGQNQHNSVGKSTSRLYL